MLGFCVVCPLFNAVVRFVCDSLCGVVRFVVVTVWCLCVFVCDVPRDVAWALFVGLRCVVRVPVWVCDVSCGVAVVSVVFLFYVRFVCDLLCDVVWCVSVLFVFVCCCVCYCGFDYTCLGVLFAAYGAMLYGTRCACCCVLLCVCACCSLK